MTTTDSLESLSQALERLDLETPPSECHGMLAGLFCARGKLSRDQWFDAVAPERPKGDLLVDEALGRLGELYEETYSQLTDPVLDFHLLLPGEEAPLASRADALGSWCQGFLLGLSVGGVRDTGKLPGDAAEVVHDLVELSRAGSYELSDSDEDESAYAELQEYVRTGVLLINEEMNPIKAPPVDPKTLH